MRRALRHFVYFLGYGVLGLLIAVIAAYAWHLGSLPGLEIWHTVRLDAEFRAADADKVRTLADYRALEDRLFAQLKTEVYDRVRPDSRRRYNRYATGSLADPLAQPANWNRTFERTVANPRGAVLLLHGLSDAPYAMRALAERLHARGYLVVGLRLPGHGTVPSALVHATREDWAAAVRLAARDLAQRIGPGKKLYIAGYSTGAALAVEYALARLQGESLPPVGGLLLFSPAIGVSPTAALAVWQGRLGLLLGAPNLAWNEISPEYDPYKYSSFPVNAADQIHAITQLIGQRIAALGKSGAVAGMPPILAFQSVADDTVSTPAVIDALFGKLAREGHKLVLFDINRRADAAEFYLPGAPAVRESLLQGPALPFELTVLTNSSADTEELAAIRRKAGAGDSIIEPTTMKWPAGVFSLSHVALTFSPADPVYGAKRNRQGKLIYLGRPELLGERGVLAVPPSNLIRLRYNPFFDYTAGRAESFVLGER